MHEKREHVDVNVGGLRVKTNIQESAVILVRRRTMRQWGIRLEEEAESFVHMTLLLFLRLGFRSAAEKQGGDRRNREALVAAYAIQLRYRGVRGV